MTHASVAGTGAEVADNLIRLSVGIEHIDDLIGDLTEAFSRSRWEVWRPAKHATNEG